MRGWVEPLESATPDGRLPANFKFEGASVKTWNNSLSDIGDHTLLEPGSAPHTQAVDLRPGQSVEFSGTFLAGDKDCFRESSITQRGSMSEPEWIFRFQTITPKAGSRG
jgi:hypothetical protein